MRSPAPTRRVAGAAALTAREREVVELVAAGHSNSRIAGLLFLSEKTVEVHLASVFAKLGLLTDRAHNRRVLTALWWVGVGVGPTSRPGRRD